MLAASQTSKILIAGQAPGRRVHESGVPWDDPSGVRLRDWLNIDKDVFYDESAVALIPMGFCYPGTGKSGDNPPRPECRATWHDRLIASLTNVRLSIVIGQYAQDYHLGNRREKTVTATVDKWREFAPEIFPLPHPSPRNQLWLKKNPWFERDLLPELRARVAAVIG